jgi:hypothetical protein
MPGQRTADLEHARGIMPQLERNLATTGLSPPVGGAAPGRPDFHDRSSAYVLAMLAVAKREPSAFLLAGQLAALLVYPLLNGSAGRAVFSIVGIALLGLVVLAVHDSPGLTTVAIVLALPASILLLIQTITGSDDLLPYSSALESILYFYAAGALIAYMLADHEVTRDELYAVGATFTLVAWAFAYIYVVCQAIEPETFTAAVDPTGERSWMELLFMSFTTLSSTGLGDVIPVKSFGRSIVMIEQVVGLAFVAMLVSRIVGLTVLRGRIRRDAGDQR